MSGDLLAGRLAAPRRGKLRRLVASHRRLTVAMGVVVLAGAVVTLSRAGVASLNSTPAAVPARVAASGQVLQLAVGEQRIYALLDPCADQRTNCGPMLVASDDEGRTWTQRRLPGVRPATAAAVRAWRLTALQPGERLVIEADGVFYVSSGDGDSYHSWLPSQGEAAARVPANLSDLVRLCQPPIPTVRSPATCKHDRAAKERPVGRSMARSGLQDE